MLTGSVFSQNVGIGTTNPINTLHIVPSGISDPIKIEGVKEFLNEQNLLILNPVSGVIKHMHIDSLISRLNIVPDTDVDSIKFLNDSLYIYENGNVYTTHINTSLDTTQVNNLIYNKQDSLYTFIADSLSRDSLWLTLVDSDVDSVRFLNDSLYIYENGNIYVTHINTSLDTTQVNNLIYNKQDSLYAFMSDSLAGDSIWLKLVDSDVDSARLISDTNISIYENDKIINVDISNLKDSSEWVDGKLIGLTPGAIYARKILQTRGDTVVITDNSRLGIMTNNPNAFIDIRGVFDQHLRIGEINQGGNINFVRGFDGTSAASIGFANPIAIRDFTIGNFSGGGEVNVVTNAGSLTGGHFSVSSISGTSPGTHLMVNNSGLVGIGKINPEAKLDVKFAKDLSSGATGEKDWLGVVTGATKSNGNHMGLSIGVDTISNKSHLFSRLTNGINQVQPIDFNDSTLYLSGSPNNFVGIGTTNPMGHLDIRGAFYNQLRIGSAFSAGGIRFSDGSGVHNTYIGYQNFNELDTFQIFNGSGGSVVKIKTNGGLPSGLGGGFYVENISSGNPGVFFAVRNTGNVGIGTVNPTERLEVCGNVKVVGEIQANSSNLSAGLTCSSDKRLKTNITPIYGALDKIKLVDGKTYNWRVEEFPTRGFTKEKQYGFIAQELEVIFPELVKTNPDGYKSVDYLELIPILTEALKEQSVKVQTLEEQNKQIMNELKELKKLISK